MMEEGISGSSNLFLYDIHVSPVHYQTLSLTDPSSPYPPPLQLGQYEPRAHLGHFQRLILLAGVHLTCFNRAESKDLSVSKRERPKATSWIREHKGISGVKGTEV